MTKTTVQIPRWAERISDARKSLKLSQVAFAGALSTTQSNVSKWEKGSYKPAPDVFAKLAGLVEGMDKFYFLEQAGIPKEFFMGTLDQTMTQSMVLAAGKVASRAFQSQSSGEVEAEKVDAILVPLLADAIAAGNPLTINEKDIKGSIPFLRRWLPNNADVYAVTVAGDSMEPTLGEGYIAFIDTSKREPAKLVGRMVAARIGDGVTIKWLRHSNKHYTLVPQHSSPRHEVRVMNEEDDWAIIGEVVKWIGEPPATPKRR